MLHSIFDGDQSLAPVAVVLRVVQRVQTQRDAAEQPAPHQAAHCAGSPRIRSRVRYDTGVHLVLAVGAVDGHGAVGVHSLHVAIATVPVVCVVVAARAYVLGLLLVGLLGGVLLLGKSCLVLSIARLEGARRDVGYGLPIGRCLVVHWHSLVVRIACHLLVAGWVGCHIENDISFLVYIISEY